MSDFAPMIKGIIFPQESNSEEGLNGPFIYISSNFIEATLGETLSNKIIFDSLSKLDFVSKVKSRRELFMAEKAGIEYSYGNPAYANVYTSEKFNHLVGIIKDKINEIYRTSFDLCFLNKYDSATDNIGWHADDSPEMDSDHPICVVSFGETRRIQVVEKEFVKDSERIRTFNLKDGSLFMMPEGFQQTHFHRIPKEGYTCKSRISLTFRKLKKS